jgi:tetrahydromethanopterin S-methyltransferase subunit G/HAMP domain-containing protein
MDLHGSTLFVADGPVTRGIFLGAMYEYDKSLQAENRKEFSNYKERLFSMEQKVSGLSKTTSPVTEYDPDKIMASLRPKIGLFLDENIASSKLYGSLRSDVDQLKIQKSVTAAVPVSQEFISRLQKIEQKMSDSESKPVVQKEQKVGVEMQLSRIERLEKINLENSEALKNMAKRISDMDSNTSLKSSEKSEIAALNLKIQKIEDLQKDVSRIDQYNFRQDAAITEISKQKESVAKAEQSRSPKEGIDEKSFNELAKRVERVENINLLVQESLDGLRNVEKRMTAIEKAPKITQERGTDPSDLSGRIDKLESVIESVAKKQNELSQIEKTLPKMETAVSVTQSSASNIQALEQRVERMERLLAQISQLEKTIDKLSIRIDSVERISSLSGMSLTEDMSAAARRLDQLEESVSVLMNK